MANSKITELLGDKAEELLGFSKPAIDKSTLHLPGPDHIDRIWTNSNRSNQVLRNGTPIDLSAKEFALLAYFVAHPAETLSRDRLLDAVWGYENYPNTRTVDTHIVHLRQKLEPNPEEPRFILTVHGTGYKFVG